MKNRLLGSGSLILIGGSAWAQTAAAPPATFDFTALAVSIVGGVFSVIGIVLTALINSRMKDKQAADTLDKALTNSLGAIEQATDATIDAAHPHTSIPGVSSKMAVGIQYVLDHAGDEATRLGVTPEAIAEKITARIGVAKINAVAPPIIMTTPTPAA